jgi:rSAM/selenodomain-associated transferase 2
MSLKKSRISVVIPVLLELDIINSLLKSLRMHDAEHLREIIVVDYGNTTINSVDWQNGEWEKLNLISSNLRGRALQMNLGAKVAKGDILLFLHADTILPRNALFSIIDLLKDEKYSAGAFNLGFDDDSLKFKLLGIITSLRSKLTKIPYGDQALFVRKEQFDEICGFMPMSLFEDVDFCRRLKAKKFQIGIVSSKVLTSSRRFQKCFMCNIIKNWFITILYYLGYDVDKLAKLYN